MPCIVRPSEENFKNRCVRCVGRCEIRLSSRRIQAIAFMMYAMLYDNRMKCNIPVEPKTRTHHGRVGSCGSQRGGGSGRASQSGAPTGLFAQDTTVSRVLQGIEDKCSEPPFESTNKIVSM